MTVVLITLQQGGAGGLPDSDDDGFIDLVDLCPNQPETFNGILR